MRGVLYLGEVTAKYCSEKMCMPVGGMLTMLKGKREMYIFRCDVYNYLSLNTGVIAAANSHVTIPHETLTCPWID